MKIVEIHVFQHDLPVQDPPYRMALQDVWHLDTTIVLLVCEDGWCKIETAGHQGWLPISNLWGVYDGEVVE